ncbi:hypothetical protein CVT24_002985 [Panaeolus cyanescens]|uniref:Autophagy-related protein 27 n=1 Tax=Panaeolus cyanescens TaxID=181874 RepID=A0A409W1K6_9AGAR|nr:hypothetical protein CVT24_002985 [Panaeolus cyanescens]
MFDWYKSRKISFISLFLLLCCTISAYGDGRPCTTTENGKIYDLSPLTLSKDYDIKLPSGLTLSINICQNVKSELWGLKDGLKQEDVGGFVRRAHGDFAIGKVNSSLTIVDGRPRLSLSEGSRCMVDNKATDIRASSIIEFNCDSSMFGPGRPRLVAQLPPGDDEAGCAFVIEWTTPYACPSSQGGGFWGFIAILAAVFLVLLMTYTVLGTLYNRYVLQLRGFDQIPQFSIESMKYHGSEALDWIRDIAAQFNIGTGGHSHGNYDSLPSAGIRTPNPVSHQAQVGGLGPQDLESTGQQNGFVRPQRIPSTVNPFQRAEINPVSHHSQSLSFSASNPQSPPSLAHPQPQTPTQPIRQSGNEFTLDDEDDGEELVDVNPPQSSSSPPSQTTPTATNIPHAPTTPTSTNTAAAARGRDLGEEGNIQL